MKSKMLSIPNYADRGVVKKHRGPDKELRVVVDRAVEIEEKNPKLNITECIIKALNESDTSTANSVAVNECERIYERWF